MVSPRGPGQSQVGASATVVAGDVPTNHAHGRPPGGCWAAAVQLRGRRRRPCNHAAVSYPSYPSPTGPSAPAGWYPLRPLSIGEVIGAGLRIGTRHLAVLAPVSFVFAVISSALNLLVLSAKGALRSYANGDLTRLPAGATPEQANEFLRSYVSTIFPALAVSAVVGMIAAPVLAGVAAPFAALAATSRVGTNAAGLARLHGRWPVLLAVAVLAGLAQAVGYALLIVPGFVVWLVLLPAGPAAAMERVGVGPTLTRAAIVSKGFKGRLLGVSLLMGLITVGINLVATAIFTRVVGGDDPVTRLVITQLLAALFSSVIAPWTASVTAMLYIDIRMRREGLAKALWAASNPTHWS